MEMRIQEKVRSCCDRFIKLLNLKRKNRENTTNAVHPQIFKLNIDCMYEICGWLCLDDLNAFAQTCKPLQRIIGEYFHRKYSAVRTICHNDRVHRINDKTTVLSQLIERVIVRGHVADDQRFCTIASMKSLRRIQFITVTLTPTKLNCIKKTLGQLESLRFNCCNVVGDFNANLLRHCENLERLSVRSTGNILIGSSNKWLPRNYPKLKSIEITQRDGDKISELDTFFTLNPNIRSIAVNIGLLEKNRHAFLNTNLQLNHLAININFFTSQDVDSFCELTQQLHERGFYQHLHLYAFNLDQNSIEQLSSLPNFTKLHVSDTPNTLDLSALIELREICLCDSSVIENIENLAKKLVNLERVYCYQASYCDILPFFRHSAKLKQIKVRHLQMTTGNCNDGILNLPELNKVRMQLRDSQKVTIYVKEELFMPTKWAMKTINFDKVEMKFVESYDWGHFFGD